jgi:hypothetical protein
MYFNSKIGTGTKKGQRRAVRKYNLNKAANLWTLIIYKIHGPSANVTPGISDLRIQNFRDLRT